MTFISWLPTRFRLRTETLRSSASSREAGCLQRGVKMIGRRHKADGSGGFALCESDDLVALAKWTQDWSDLLEFETFPVLDDKQIGIVLGA